jgi:hypothetical protein
MVGQNLRLPVLPVVFHSAACVVVFPQSRSRIVIASVGIRAEEAIVPSLFGLSNSLMTRPRCVGMARKSKSQMP